MNALDSNEISLLKLQFRKKNIAEKKQRLNFYENLPNQSFISCEQSIHEIKENWSAEIIKQTLILEIREVADGEYFL